MPEIEEIFDHLKELKTEIDAAKSERSEKRGQLSEQMKLLKEFEIDNITEAKKKIKQLNVKLKSLENKITRDFQTLQEKYEW